jgi:hypothetical protein
VVFLLNNPLEGLGASCPSANCTLIYHN